MKKLSEITPKRRAVKGPSRRDPRLRLLVDLKALRTKQGVTVRDCQKASGIDQSTFWRIENGGEPSLINALMMAQFYGLSVDNIWALTNGTKRSQGRAVGA